MTALVSSGDPIARELLGPLWMGEGIETLARSKRQALHPALAEELRDLHRRLGASPQSMAALESLARGEAVCSIAGQQPAVLGGPLYALHKTASAVGLAARVRSRTGVPCVPMFWTHSEDSDFAEIRSITVADRELATHEVALPEGLLPEGGLIGALGTPALETVGREVERHWAQLPHGPQAAEMWKRAVSRGRDLGEACSALWLDLFGSQGLVVIDPRLPAFRAAARPWIDRYLEHAESAHRAARSGGEAVEHKGGRRIVVDAALESFVFEVKDGVRRKVKAEEARALGRGSTLSPSVALRPVLQDAVLPTVAMACGPSELAYLAQVRGVFRELGVTPALPVPRWGATWLPPAAVALIDAAKADPWEVVADADSVLRRLAESRVPADLRREIESVRAATFSGLDRVAESSKRLDPSLPQLVESVRAKLDYQLGRLSDGMVSKSRHRLEREHPAWARLRYYLAPGDKLQERRIAALEPLAHRGPSVAAELCELATEHARELEQGHHSHHLLEL